MDKARFRLRRVHRNDTGATLVEAAIVLPLVLLLTFAALDGALYMKDHLTIGTAARNGARAAASGGADVQADYYVLQAVNKTVKGIGVENITRIVVYKASAYGAEPTSACAAGNATPGVCNVYLPQDFNFGEGAYGGGDPSFGRDLFWPAQNRSVTRSGPGADLVGVQVQGIAETPTGVLGSKTFSIDRHTVLQIEARRG